MVRRRIISTLCPKRLPPADFVNLSGRLQPRVTVPRFGTAQFFYAIDNVAHRLKPFPPGTHGFFYYYTPPKAPPFVGEVRFRRASDPDSFEGGKDLLSPDETPWSLSLYALANRGSHAVLRNQLVHDGLISPAALEKWAQHSENRSPTAAMLYYLRQPFIYRFDRHFLSLYAVTREKINFCHEISFTRGISGRGVPYSGSGMVQLERYGDDQVALRVLKILEPVRDLVKDYDGPLCRPTEGELIQELLGDKTAVVTRNLSDALTLPINLEDLP